MQEKLTIDRDVRWVDSIVNDSVSVIPLLVVVLLEMVLPWVDCKVGDNRLHGE